MCAGLAAEAKAARLLVWDNARWQISQRVRAWIRAHNRRAKRQGAIVEPDRLLTAQEVTDRVGGYYGCEQSQPLEQKIA